MTTAATFYASFRDLSLTGVTNKNEPQLEVPSALLPLKWVDSVSLDDKDLLAKRMGGDKVIRCRVVVLVEAPGQDRHANRWSDTITMMDTLEAAMVAMTRPSQGMLEWTIEATPSFDGSGYFAVIAEVTGVDIGG